MDDTDGNGGDDKKPIGEVLPSFRLHPLEPNWTPLQAFVLVKSFDEDGDTAWAFRTSEPFNLEELLGALTVQVEVLRAKLVRQWVGEDEEED